MDAYKRLASAIIIQALQDLQNQRDVHGIDTFFHSEYFSTLVEFLELDPMYIRHKVATQAFDAKQAKAIYR